LKPNYRWLLQAFAFIGSVFFFLQIWEKSQMMFVKSTFFDWMLIAIYVVFFFFCFFLMGITSYLKQKGNDTLKNSIPLFEWIIEKFHLMDLLLKKE